MKAWVVNEGEPLPLDGCGGKQMRAGIIAIMLAEMGNHVTWWSSTYIHYEKRYYCNHNQNIQINNNLCLKLLHSIHGYKKNISVKRIMYSKELGRIFRDEAEKDDFPDVIYCSWPLIDFSYECVRFGQIHDIPVIIDIRDFWPDIFVQPFLKIFQPLAKVVVRIYTENKVSYVMKNATAVVGVVPKILDFANSHGRQLCSSDHVVYLASDNALSSELEKQRALQFWNSLGVNQEKFIVAYVGSINKRIVDFDTVVKTAKECKDSDILFILCGIGKDLKGLAEKTKNTTNVILPGYRNKGELQMLLELSQIGLLPYHNTQDFVDSVPTKFGEYLSGGLIILSGLKGLSRRMLEEYKCGAYYHDADSLLAQISKVKENRLLQTEMSSNAVNLYHQKFNASVVYGEFCEFLETLGKKNKPR